MAAVTAAVVTAGSTVYAANQQKKAASNAANAQIQAAETGAEEARLAREQFVERTEPFRQAGLRGLKNLTYSAGRGAALSDRGLFGLDKTLPQERLQFDPAQAVSAGGFDQTLAEVNPLVSFLRDEGFQDIQESAAAKGRLQSGGTLKDLSRFNTQLASTVVPQLQQQKFDQALANQQLGLTSQQLGAAFNAQNFSQALQGQQLGLQGRMLAADLQNQRVSQLQNLASLGANAATGQGNAAISTAGTLGNLALGAGQAAADANINRANANTAMIQSLGSQLTDYLKTRK